MAAGKPNKGWPGKLRRAAVLPTRYGLGAEPFRRRLEDMVSDLHSLEITPTIPVTARTLARHPELVRDLKGAEVAVHGYHHTAYTSLEESEQSADLAAARDFFADISIPATGFRAPYLRLAPQTLSLLSQHGFTYDSSVPRLADKQEPWPDSLRNAIMMRYGISALNAHAPFVDSQVVEIPVCLPDDEVLVDGVGLYNPNSIGRIFSAMLEGAEATHSLLVMQIHPERYHICERPLREALRAAADKGAWIAPLQDIARRIASSESKPPQWPRGSPFALAVTGDLDAAALSDFATRFLGGG